MKPGISNSSSSRNFLSAVLLLAALSAPAAVINWTNTGGGWWSLDSNWSPNQVPSTNDIAVITNSGSYTVSLNLAPTLAGLVLGGGSGTQTLSTAEQVLQLNGNGTVGAHGVFKLALGALSGDARLAVSGALVWDGGTIDTNAVVTIAAGGRMLIGPGANYGRVLHGAVTNAGTITWATSGWLFIGGVLHNLGSGLFDAQWSAPIVRYGTGPLIINDGVFRKSVDGGGIDCSVPVVNNATVDVQAGTMLLGDGSVLNSGCQFIGAGVTRMDTGTNLLNGSVLSSNLMLNGATLAGAGSFTGILRWNAGTIGDGATVLIPPNSWLDISSGAEAGKALVGSLTNAGTITYRPYGPFGIVGLLHNTATGLFEIQDPNRDLANWGPAAVIINDGVFRKSGQSLGVACAVPIINNGTVDTQTGRLALADGSVFNSGCQFIGQGMTICGPGTNTLNGTLYSENLVLDGVTLKGAGAVSGKVQWAGGTIDSGAAVLITSNSWLDISSGAEAGKALLGNLTNAGTITYKPYGPLGIVGVLHNTSSGLLDIQDPNRDLANWGPGALIVNDGVFRKSGQSLGVACAVPLINNGVVEAQTGRLGLADGSVFNSGCHFIGQGMTICGPGTNTLNGILNSENLVLDGVTLKGAGVVNGKVQWAGGIIDWGATVLITSNSWLNISSGAEADKALLGNLTNAGTITYKSLGSFGIVGLLHNTATGLFDIQDPNRDLAKWGPAAVIVNDGIFRKSGQSLGVACAVPLINNSTVDTQAGRLGLADGSVFNSGCQFIGQGMTICGPGTNTLNGTLYSENLVLDGVTLKGAGVLSGKVQWASGIIDSGARLLVATNGWLDISSGAEAGKALVGSLTNAGTITYKPTGPLGLAGVLHNAPGGLFEIQDPNRDLANWSSAATFINQGIFRKTGSGGRTCSVPFTNHGTVEVIGGVLGFDGGYANPAGTISLQGGTFLLPQPLELAGGLLTGWGTVQADVLNAATLRPARSGGPLTIQGNYSQGLGGKMEFELAGNNPGVDQGRLNITGAARLRGTIGVLWADAYLPEPGTNFAVLAFASRQGQFCCFDNFILLGHGRQLTPVYSATGVTLAAIPAAEPTAVPLRVTVDGGALVCWPVEFPGYSLYWATNLSQPNWTLLPGVVNHFLESPPLANEKFFRLHKP